MTPLFDAHDDPDINRVWTWFEYQNALIAESRAVVVGATNSAALHGLRGQQSQFIGWDRAEVAEFFDWQRGQLELLLMFELLATTEAVLRIEVRSRVNARKKDSLSRRFRELHKSRAEKIRLDEDILVAMKEEGVCGKAISDFRGALKLRHWMAHGRHWHPKLGRGYAPGDVFDISRALIDEIPPS